VLAIVPAFACSSWKRCAYEGFGRDDWQQPARVIESLELRPGDRVADLGAGGGYFTFRLAEAVGETGRVYAVDVDEDMVSYLKERAEEEGFDNVEAVLASFDDPRLPDGEIDLLFTSNTYHHLEDRVAYFSRVRSDLKPGGRVAVVDFQEDASWFVRWFGHGTEGATVTEEMTAAGYRLEREFDFTDRQSFQIFRAQP
jgi:ubiquinone/menaquinone biosynthesis C-methylase UbiE